MSNLTGYLKWSCVSLLIGCCFLLLTGHKSHNKVDCDNIGGKCYPGSRHLPIDVVYTWVNGSDPLLLKNIGFFKEIANGGYQVDYIAPEKKFTGRSLLMKEESESVTNLDEDKPDSPFESPRECPIESCIKSPIIVSSSYVNIHDQTLTTDYVKTFIGFANAIDVKMAIPENMESSLLFIKFPSTVDADLACKNVLTVASKTMRFKGVFYSLQHGDGPFIQTSSKLVDLSTCNETVVHQHPGILSFDSMQNLICIEKDTHPNLSANCKIHPENFLVWPPWEKYNIGKLSFSDVGAHRFADNQELRYSIRSLYQNAPWVRSIFILTNGQIPKWLNINHNKIKVIAHSEVFQNKSHLPTFSSPSIEANMHNIPGLSEHFLYLNDDVFFGKPVYPEDFISSDGYKIFLAWNIPNCNAGCPPNWIRDGYCDLSCNVSSCNFDGGDCDAGSQSAGNILVNNLVNNAPGLSASYASNYCNTGCSKSWVGDKYCDPACNVYACGFDAGDCGVNEIQSKVYEIEVARSLNNSEISVTGVPAMYFNVSFPNDTVSAASYETVNEDQNIIRTSILSLAHQILSLTFFPNETGTVTVTMATSTGECLSLRLAIDSSSLGSEYTKPNRYQFIKTPNEASESTTEKWRIPKLKEIIIEDGYGADINNLLTSSDLQLQSQDVLIEDNKLRELVEAGLLTDKGRWVKLGQFVNEKKDENNLKRKLLYFETLPQRKTLDTFADSLHHVNNLYSDHFGKEQRKVISHMPFLVKKSIVEDLHSRFPTEFNKTSSNRFRSSDDMQFAFSYFYFVIHAKHKQNVEEFLQMIDRNNDGEFSTGELNILLTHLFDLPLTTYNRTRYWNLIETCSKDILKDRIGPANILQCTNLSAIIDSVMQNITTYPHQIVDDKDVTFKMLKSNSSKVRVDLDYIRKNPKKFICLNDNMDHGDSLEHLSNVEQLEEFYQTMFPDPSPFEYLPGRENKYLYKAKYKNDVCDNYLYLLFYVIFVIVVFRACFLKSRSLRRITRQCLLKFL